MKTTKSFGEYPKYSLHDARVQKIEYVDDSLIFTFDYIFSYENGVEHKAQVIFEKCDIDDLEILVFNSTILDTFTGKRIELPQYQQDYSGSEFEVITETYNWGRAVLQGWLWTEGNPVHCIMMVKMSSLIKEIGANGLPLNETVDYSALRGGTEFLIMEGSNIVGEGVVRDIFQHKPYGYK